jgi:hypothetical protein
LPLDVYFNFDQPGNSEKSACGELVLVHVIAETCYRHDVADMADLLSVVLVMVVALCLVAVTAALLLVDMGIMVVVDMEIVVVVDMEIVVVEDMEIVVVEDMEIGEGVEDMKIVVGGCMEIVAAEVEGGMKRVLCWFET